MQGNDKILEVLRRNEAIRAKFFEIENEILTILKFEGLFARLTSLIQEKFEIPHVWITLFTGGDLECMLEDMDCDSGGPCRLVLVDREVGEPLLRGHGGPVLDNVDLGRFAPLMPSPAPPDIRSIAVAPLRLDGQVVGSLNQPDSDPGRFSPEMDSTLLAQLALKVSLCLSNVTAHEKLARLALCDPLTGLLNRRALEESLQSEFLRAQRYGAELSVAFIDMDDFKLVNDSLGHDAGDAVLSYFARKVAKMARKIDTCARFAGDEFVVLLPNTSLDQARAFMDRVVKFFQFTPVPGLDRYVKFSCGVASTKDPGATSPTALLKLADEELFRRKADKPTADTRKVVGGQGR